MMNRLILHSIALLAITGMGMAYGQEQVAERIIVETADGASVFVTTVAEAAPAIIGAVILLVIGFFVSFAIGKAVQKRAHKVLTQSGYDEADLTGISSENEKGVDTSHAVGATVRWFVFLFFVVAAVNLLEFSELTQALEVVWLWFPNVIAAIIAIILGVTIVRVSSKWADKELEHTDFQKHFKTLVKATVFTVIASIALTQLGIGESILPIVIAAISVSVAIALGFGLKDIIPSTLRGMTNPSAKMKLGQRVKIGDLEGIVTSSGLMHVTIVNDKDECITIPAKELNEKSITIFNGKSN